MRFPDMSQSQMELPEIKSIRTSPLNAELSASQTDVTMSSFSDIVNLMPCS
jgi:hypothetical protein